MTSTPSRDAGTGRDYPIEGGLPHPRWIRDRSEHALATVPVVIVESRATIATLTLLVFAAFLAGLVAFWPASALPT